MKCRRPKRTVSDLFWGGTMYRNKSTAYLASHSKQVRPWHRYVMAIVVVLSLNIGPRAVAAGPGDCAALIGNSSPVGVIRNTSITSATYVTSAGGNYCEVAATVAPEHDVL